MYQLIDHVKLISELQSELNSIHSLYPWGLFLFAFACTSHKSWCAMVMINNLFTIVNCTTAWSAEEKKITNSVHPLAWCVGCVVYLSFFFLYFYFLAVPLLAAYRHCITSFDVCPHIRTFAFIGWIATNESLKRIKCTHTNTRGKALHVALNLFIMSEWIFF